jgi:exopolyphosphatase/guanosine-5'-triphosphate,3'-diphosphate pyrophosphatase
MPKIAAIDIGSNAIRMAVAEVSAAGLPQNLKHYREPVRMGADVFTVGRVGRETLGAALAALNKYQAIMKAEGVLNFRAVATEALRRADNCSEVLQTIELETGLKVEIISPQTEAELVLNALSQKIDLTGKNVLHLELGGGSLELSTVLNGALAASQSFELGAIRLLQNIKTTDKDQGLSDISKLAGPALEWLNGAQKDHQPDILIGTGGSLELLADLAVQITGSGKKNLLHRGSLERIVDSLIPLNLKQRMDRFNLKPDRADVALPAALLLLVLIGRTELAEIQVPRVGLKEGLLMAIAQSLKTGNSNDG